jgi:hypothetical protein
LLLAGFIERESRLFYITESDCQTVEIDRRHAIGIGAGAAIGMLDWRGISTSSSLDHSLYAAYESKRISEGSRWVGSQSTFISYLVPDGTSFANNQIFGENFSRLEQAFEILGPKPIPRYWSSHVDLTPADT